MSKLPDKHHKKDQELFSEAVSGITPLVQDRIISSSEKIGTFVPRNDFNDSDSTQTSSHTLSDLYDPFENQQQKFDLNYHHESISNRQFIKLKKSHFTPDFNLDLHGLNKQQAKKELLDFIQHCKQHDFRRIAIMPGQGLGVLRQSLNIWLRQLPEVLAFAESPEHSGGKGVIRVLLTGQAEKSSID